MYKQVLIVFSLLILTFSGCDLFEPSSEEIRKTVDLGVEQVKSTVGLSSEQSSLMKIQLSIADFKTRKGRYPSTLAELVPVYFDSIPMDPTTKEILDYELTLDGYILGGEENSETYVEEEKTDESNVTEIAIVNPADILIENAVYESKGKRDPFEPFDYSGKIKVDESLPPLERYTLGQLKVTAILADSSGGGKMMAIVEDQEGKGYPVREGTRIGNLGGVVVNVEADRVNVIETITDFSGNVEKRPTAIKLQKVEEDSRNKNKKKK